MPLKIDELYAWIALNEDGEGIVAAFDAGSNMAFPLIGADKERIESYRHIAEQVATTSIKKISLMRFSNREVLEVVKPKQGFPFRDGK